MSLCVFIDFGYVQAAGARTVGHAPEGLSPESGRRRGVGDYGLARGGASPGELVRVYWYDGAYAPRHRNFGARRRYFDAIADTPRVR